MVSGMVKQDNCPEKHNGQYMKGYFVQFKDGLTRGWVFWGMFLFCFCHKILSVFQGGSEDRMKLSDILRKSVYNSK